MPFTRSLYNSLSFSKTPKKLASQFKWKNNSPLNPIQTCNFSPGQNIQTAGSLLVMLTEQFKKTRCLKKQMEFKYWREGGWGSFEASSVYGCTAVNKKQRNTACFTGNPGIYWKLASFLPSCRLQSLKKHHPVLWSRWYSLQLLSQYLSVLAISKYFKTFHIPLYLISFI